MAGGPVQRSASTKTHARSFLLLLPIYYLDLFANKILLCGLIATPYLLHNDAAARLYYVNCNAMFKIIA